jgi:hypothetical protein
MVASGVRGQPGEGQGGGATQHDSSAQALDQGIGVETAERLKLMAKPWAST